MKKMMCIQNADRSTMMTTYGDIAQEMLDQMILKSADFKPVLGIVSGTMRMECVKDSMFSLANCQLSVQAKAGWFFEYRVSN